MKLFILVLIYGLTFINIMLLIFLLIRKAINIFREKKYQEYEKRMLSEIEYSMMNDSPKVFLSKFLNHQKRSFIYRLLITLASEKGEDYHIIFDEAGFTQEKLRILSKSHHLEVIKDLSIIRSPMAYNSLFEMLNSPYSEVAYRAAYALANIELDSLQQKELIETLIHTNIVIDRVIEIIDIINPPIEDYFSLLKQQKDIRGKIILLHFLKNKMKNKDTNYRFLQKKIRMGNTKLIEHVLPFIYEEDEVANSAILVLAETKEMEALEAILEKLRITNSDQVKITIARSLYLFPPYKVIPYLRKMIDQETWWVKFHAFESLLKLGLEGHNEIKAISMNADNPIQADLAYQMIGGKTKTYRMIKSPLGKEEEGYK